MITELEKQFYRTFGIEPKYQDACTVEDKYWQNEELANKYGTFDMYMNAKCGNQENCTTQCSCAYTKEIYPEITDTVLLELICILNFKFPTLHNACGSDRKTLLEYVLTRCITDKNYVEQQVRQLFKEEE